MKRLFLIRFAKDRLETALYVSEYEKQFALTPNVHDAFAWKTKKEAEGYINAILKVAKNAEMAVLLEVDMQVEEHHFGKVSH